MSKTNLENCIRGLFPARTKARGQEEKSRQVSKLQKVSNLNTCLVGSDEESTIGSELLQQARFKYPPGKKNQHIRSPP